MNPDLVEFMGSKIEVNAKPTKTPKYSFNKIEKEKDNESIEDQCIL